MSEYITCPIWGTPAAELSDPRDGKLIDSPRAGGKYFISGTAEAPLQSCDEQVRVRITNWIVEQRRLKISCPEIMETTIKEAKQGRDMDISVRGDNVLRYLRNKSHILGYQIKYEIRDTFYHGEELKSIDIFYLELLSHSTCVGDNDFLFLLSYLTESGFVERIGRNNSLQGCILTVAGYAHLAELEASHTPSSKAFVAM